MPTEENVRLIRQLRGCGFTYRKIAVAFGVHEATIGKIIRGARPCSDSG